MPLVTLGSKPSGIKKGVKRLADWSLPYHHSLRRKKKRKGGMDIAWLLLKLKVSLNFAATSTGNTHAWPVVTTPPPNPAHWCLTLLVKLHYINTRVYSWNTYPVCLFVMNTLPAMPDRFRICLYFHMHIVELLTINTRCDFKKGGAKKPIIGRSWNNGKKNCLVSSTESFQCDSVGCFSLIITSLNALATLLEVCRHTHAQTHRHDSISLPPLCMCTQGNTPYMIH